MKYSAIILFALIGFASAASIKEEKSLHKTPTNNNVLLQNNEECAPGCPIRYINDGWFDEECYVPQCNFDGKDGLDYACLKFCIPSMLGDGFCDFSCGREACDYDHGDCKRKNFCADGCPFEYINDGYCDKDCFNKECKYDGTDCNNLK